LQGRSTFESLQNRPRTRRRPPDFAPSFRLRGGYVGQAVLETERIIGAERLRMTRDSTASRKVADPSAVPQALEDSLPDVASWSLSDGAKSGGRNKSRLTETVERIREDLRPEAAALPRPRNGRPEAFRTNAAHYTRARSRPEEGKAVL